MNLKKACMEARIDQLTEENIRLKDALDREVQDNMILKDKVEGLQDKLDKARIELDYLIHRYYTEESYELTIEEIERIMGILKGDNNK